MAYTELGWLLEGEGKVQEASDLLRGFVDRYPYNWEAYNGLYEIVAWGVGDYDAAMSIAEEAVTRNPDRVWPLLLLAASHVYEMTDAADPEKALAALEQALALRPESSRVLRWVGQIRADMGDMDLALDYYRRALEINPGGLAILSSVTIELLQAGRHEEALVYALRARDQAPGVAIHWMWDSYTLLAGIMPRLGKADEYYDIIRAATEKYGQDNPRFYLYLASEQRKRGEIEEAISSYRSALAIKESAPALAGLGGAQWLLGDTEAALASLIAAREVGGTDIPWSRERHIISLLKYLGRHNEIEDRLGALKAAGNIDTWFWASTEYYFSMRRFDDAIALGKDMLQSTDVTWKNDILWLMVEWYRMNGDLEQSLSTVEEAMAVVPPSYHQLLDHDRALTEAIRGNLDDAEVLARQAVESGTGGFYWPVYLATLGRLQYAAGRIEEALETLVDAEKTFRTDPTLPALYLRAQIKGIGRSGDSEDDLKKVHFYASRRARSDSPYGDKLAVERSYSALAAARLGDRETAGDEIAYALRLEPESAGIAYFAAAAYSLIGDTEQALDWLETAVERGDLDLWWARVDPDLDPLRDHARFNEIMTDWDTRLRALR
jgi:tetratricopeptide (TPR) repeat protein